MDKLLAIASKAADQAEVFSFENSSSSVEFENAELQDIKGTFESGYSLRIIKDGKLGFAYTRNLIDREELVQGALASMKGGVEGEYNFPATTDLPELDTFSPAINDATSTTMVEECDRICDVLKSRTKGEIAAGTSTSITTIRLANSAGTNAALKSSACTIWGGVIYPGSANGIYRTDTGRNFTAIPESTLDEIVDIYNASEEVVEPEGGRMKVLFMPSSLITLIWRLTYGANAKNVYELTSPLADKVGEKVFSDILTVYNDPLDITTLNARPFDDEGTPCTRFTVIQNGVMKGFYNDLNYAKKNNVEPNGHGFRSGMWGGDPLAIKPSPSMPHLRIQPGDKSLKELIQSMDRGIILEGALGAHSGNIPNGDYSVGISPGMYVEDGQIKGRVKDAMVAGNIYETLQNVTAIENRVSSDWGGHFPALLCDNVSVSCKK